MDRVLLSVPTVSLCEGMRLPALLVSSLRCACIEKVVHSQTEESWHANSSCFLCAVYISMLGRFKSQKGATI